MRKVCAFFGHRDTSSKIEPLIEKQIRRLIIEKGVNTFWIGGYGWFDIYASGILRKLKREYPNIHIVLVAAYIHSNCIVVEITFLTVLTIRQKLKPPLIN